MSLTDQCYSILFDKSDFFNYKTKPFIYFFPNTSFPHIQIINNRPCVPFYSQFLIVRIRHAHKILRNHGIYVYRLPDRLVSTIKKYLNNYFVYLFLQSKQQKQIKEKKRQEKNERRKNFYMQMFTNVKSKLMDKFTSAGSEVIESQPESSDSNSVVPDPPLQESEKPKLPLPLILRKKEIQNYVTVNYDNAQRACYYIKNINRLFNKIVPPGYNHSHYGNDLRCTLDLSNHMRYYFKNRYYFKLLTNILPSFKYFVNRYSVHRNDSSFFVRTEFNINSYTSRDRPSFVEDLINPSPIPSHTFYSFSLDEEDLDDIEFFLTNGILKLIK